MKRHFLKNIDCFGATAYLTMGKGNIDDRKNFDKNKRVEMSYQTYFGSFCSTALILLCFMYCVQLLSKMYKREDD